MYGSELRTEKEEGVNPRPEAEADPIAQELAEKRKVDRSRGSDWGVG